MVSSFPENRQYFWQYVNTRPHTINNIVNKTDIDNIIDRVRSAIEKGLGIESHGMQVHAEPTFHCRY